MDRIANVERDLAILKLQFAVDQIDIIAQNLVTVLALLRGKTT